MSGLNVSRIAAALGAMLLVCPAVALSADETDAVRDARKAYESAKRDYERALETQMKRSLRAKDSEAAERYRSTLTSLQVGFDVESLSGPWRFDYDNGATRTYLFLPGGRVRFSEEGRSGRAVARDGNLIITFDGMSEAEIVTLEPTWKILHYNPASNLGRTPPKHTAVGMKIQ